MRAGVVVVMVSSEMRELDEGGLMRAHAVALLRVPLISLPANPNSTSLSHNAYSSMLVADDHAVQMTLPLH